MINKLIILVVCLVAINSSKVFAQNDSLMFHYKTGEVKGLKISNIYKSNLDIYLNGSQDISLKTGWNLISSNIIPLGKESIRQIFSNVLDKIIIVKNRVGASFIPSFDIDQINTWNYRNAYLVYCTSNTTVTIDGVIAKPTKESINLTTGWNWVSYLRSEPLNSFTALDSILGENELLIAKDLSGKVFIPSFGINTIGEMQRGVGYQMYLFTNTTLTYPN